jgi:hypothetical protein
LGSTVQKQSLCLPEKKVLNPKNYQNPKKMPTPETLSSTIELIRKLSVAIK